ncbi:MAG: hypothetical protein ACP5XB_31705 [Isosphaeraceae bacterium]
MARKHDIAQECVGLVVDRGAGVMTFLRASLASRRTAEYNRPRWAEG